MGGSTAGDTAVAWGTYTIVMVSKDSGAEVTEVGRYTDVQKKSDGRWQYIVDHASDDPAPVAADAASEEPGG
jgi:ketosteroid isomerase-like protein